MATQWSEDEELNRIKKYAMHLSTGRITFEEYAHTVLIMILNLPLDLVKKSVELIPDAIVEDYADFLRSYLEPVDFMPYPTAFLVGGETEESVKKKQRELKPKYVEVLRIVAERAHKTRNCFSND
jgi:hypothetical protein